MNKPRLSDRLRHRISDCLANGWPCLRRTLYELRQHALISAVFATLMLAQWFSTQNYWQNTLQPRLRSSSETLATIIAQSHTAALKETLEHSEPAQMRQQLEMEIQEILVVVDPATGTSPVLGLALNIDYDHIPVTAGSLDLQEGDNHCDHCFEAVLPLINNQGEQLGLTRFLLSDAYYQQLAGDMKNRLFRDSLRVLLLLMMVWIIMLIVFHRLHQAKRQIEASDRAKTRFLANVTHELRTPLNGILGYSQLLKGEPQLMAEHGKGIKTIDRCARHLLLMINDILDFARADEERLELHPQELHLPSFLLALIQMTEIRARERGIELECIGPAQIPTLVLADEKRLRQIALNLTSNAIKFTERGKVTIFMTILDMDNTSVLIRWKVRDTGIGIATEDMKKIFVPFQQIDNNITRAEGSGLGLSICERLLRLMGSRLRVSSEPGKGSDFWFDVRLPLLSNEMTTTERPEATAKAEAPVALHLPPEADVQRLRDAAAQHNILAVRAELATLQQQPELQAFVQEIEPMTSQYRFKALVEWLDQQSKAT